MHISRDFRLNNYGNNLKKVTFTQKDPNINDRINNTLEKLLERTKLEVPEYGRLFKPVEEEFTNPNVTSIAHKINISVRASTYKENQFLRNLKIEISSPSGNSISPFLKTGTKEEIMKMIKKEGFCEEISEMISKTTTAMLKKTL